jgi:hypothetical protein
MEVLGCGVMEQVILDKNYGEGEGVARVCGSCPIDWGRVTKTSLGRGDGLVALHGVMEQGQSG